MQTHAKIPRQSLVLVVLFLFLAGPSVTQAASSIHWCLAQPRPGSCPHLCVKHKKCPRTKYLRETHLSELQNILLWMVITNKCIEIQLTMILSCAQFCQHSFLPKSLCGNNFSSRFGELIYFTLQGGVALTLKKKYKASYKNI